VTDKTKIETGAGCTVEVWAAGPCVAVQVRQASGKTELYTVGWRQAGEVANAILAAAGRSIRAVSP
jgi:hypothetical protein